MAGVEVKLNELEQLLADVDAAAAALAAQYRVAATGLFESAVNAWPVRTGRSRGGLGMAATIEPDGAIVARVYHDPLPGDTYTRFVKLGADNVMRRKLTLQALSAKRNRYRTVTRVAADGTKYRVREMQAIKGRVPTEFYALTHLLRVPWQREVVPFLERQTEALVAQSLGAR